MTFEFGIFDSFDAGDATAGQVIARRLDFAVAAERAGIAHYHVTEHHGTPLSVCPSPGLFLAALDQLTGGRLDMGVGSGVSPYELGYFGIDAAQPRARYAETLEAVTQA